MSNQKKRQASMNATFLPMRSQLSAGRVSDQQRLHHNRQPRDPYSFRPVAWSAGFAFSQFEVVIKSQSCCRIEHLKLLGSISTPVSVASRWGKTILLDVQLGISSRVPAVVFVERHRHLHAVSSGLGWSPLNSVYQSADVAEAPARAPTSPLQGIMNTRVSCNFAADTTSLV